MTTIDDHAFFKTAVSTVLDTYSQLKYQPRHGATILASFFLSRKPNIPAGTSGEVKVISIATGTKCLPASRLSRRGELVHDSHAEVLARRCAVRWLLEEIHRVISGACLSDWITKTLDGKYTLQVGVELNLYISTVPCGDASTRFLASHQDQEMAALKDSSAVPVIDLDFGVPSRGRDNYARLGALRTKPGRADSPITLCMSCSDKIARWNVLGIQGALGSCFLESIYLSTVIIGEVPEGMRESVQEDCERAFWTRLGVLQGLPHGYSVHYPKIHFSDESFVHSRLVSKQPNYCAESFIWISESEPSQIIINGLKRGVAPKHRYRDKSRPLICRLTLMQLVCKIQCSIELVSLPFPHIDYESSRRRRTYLEMKTDAETYQHAKNIIIGESGPFAGWILSGLELQGFHFDGQVGIVEEQASSGEE